MRQPLFRFFSSVKLAVVLISVLIVASIAGTLYETSFDARVARAYIYNAWWFNLWLTILCLNLTCSAFSRWPWKRHHTGFLLTHLGIIVLLVGAMIGRHWGIEGTMTLFKGQPPDNQLMIPDERVLRVEDGNDGRGEIRQYPVEIIGRRPSAARPWRLGPTAGGWELALVDYAPALEASFEPKAASDENGAVPDAGQPAVRVRLVSKRLKQSMDQWLLVGNTDHSALDLGLASVQVRSGTAPAVDRLPKTKSATAAAPTGDTVNEGVFAFALQPDAPIAQPIGDGKPSGVKVRLKTDNGKPVVFLDWQGATWNFDPVTQRGEDEDLGGSGLSAVIENYWPDFVIGQDKQPATASDEPRNPAVLVRIYGQLAASTEEPSKPPTGAAPNIGTAADNQATVYCDAAGVLTFILKSSALPEPLRGTLQPGQPINTGWADWQLEAVQTLPTAVAHMEFRPIKDTPVKTTDDQSATSGDPNLVGNGGAGPMAGNPGANGNHVEGVRVRLTRGGAVIEQWAASGWEFTLPTAPRPTKLSYDFRIEPLPIGLQLDGFEVTFNEGTDNPASFKSNLRVTDVEGATGHGKLLDESPVQLSGELVEHVQRIDVQDVAGLVESAGP